MDPAFSPCADEEEKKLIHEDCLIYHQRIGLNNVYFRIINPLKSQKSQEHPDKPQLSLPQLKLVCQKEKPKKVNADWPILISRWLKPRVSYYESLK